MVKNKPRASHVFDKGGIDILPHINYYISQLNSCVRRQSLWHTLVFALSLFIIVPILAVWTLDYFLPIPLDVVSHVRPYYFIAVCVCTTILFVGVITSFRLYNEGEIAAELLESLIFSLSADYEFGRIKAEGQMVLRVKLQEAEEALGRFRSKPRFSITDVNSRPRHSYTARLRASGVMAIYESPEYAIAEIRQTIREASIVWILARAGSNWLTGHATLLDDLFRKINDTVKASTEGLTDFRLILYSMEAKALSTDDVAEMIIHRLKNSHIGEVRILQRELNWSFIYTEKRAFLAFRTVSNSEAIGLVIEFSSMAYFYFIMKKEFQIAWQEADVIRVGT